MSTTNLVEDLPLGVSISVTGSGIVGQDYLEYFALGRYLNFSFEAWAPTSEAARGQVLSQIMAVIEKQTLLERVRGAKQISPVERSRRELFRFVNSRPNWDGKGSSPPSPKLLTFVDQLLQQIQTLAGMSDVSIYDLEAETFTFSINSYQGYFFSVMTKIQEDAFKLEIEVSKRKKDEPLTRYSQDGIIAANLPRILSELLEEVTRY